MTDVGATATKMSPESNTPSGNLFAAVDLGSNSFHLIVARYEHGSLVLIDRIKEMVRLAEGVDDKGQLSAAVANRALDCLSRFGQRLSGISGQQVAAVGTNALRRMRDGWRFLEQAEDCLGHPIEIISGEEEARLIYLGVAHGVSEVGRQRLVIDIGGGSTELVIGREFNAVMVESLFFGCVAITQQFFPRWAHHPQALAESQRRRRRGAAALRAGFSGFWLGGSVRVLRHHARSACGGSGRGLVRRSDYQSKRSRGQSSPAAGGPGGPDSTSGPK